MWIRQQYLIVHFFFLYLYFVNATQGFFTTSNADLLQFPEVDAIARPFFFFLLAYNLLEWTSFSQPYFIFYIMSIFFSPQCVDTPWKWSKFRNPSRSELPRRVRNGTRHSLPVFVHRTRCFYINLCFQS